MKIIPKKKRRESGLVTSRPRVSTSAQKDPAPAIQSSPAGEEQKVPEVDQAQGSYWPYVDPETGLTYNAVGATLNTLAPRPTDWPSKKPISFKSVPQELATALPDGWIRFVDPEVMKTYGLCAIYYGNENNPNNRTQSGERKPYAEWETQWEHPKLEYDQSGIPTGNDLMIHNTANRPGVPDRRRLTNQALIDRFIRESIRCQNA